MKQQNQRAQTAVPHQSRRELARIEQEKKDEAERIKKLLIEFRTEYQSSEILEEGQSMIIIERSANCESFNMSTRQDEEKYTRIAEKLRDNILRDFPSIKVVIEPNYHKVAFFDRRPKFLDHSQKDWLLRGGILPQTKRQHRA